MSTDPATSPEREQTDESLRTERQRADHALADRHATVEEDADLVVRHARAEADAVCAQVRQKGGACFVFKN